MGKRGPAILQAIQDNAVAPVLWIGLDSIMHLCFSIDSSRADNIDVSHFVNDNPCFTLDASC